MKEKTILATILLAAALALPLPASAQSTAGEVPTTRLSPDEIRASLIPLDEYRQMVAEAAAMRSRDGVVQPLPAPEDAVFDWRDVDGEDWTTPVKNQGMCGSCTIFAGVGAIEGAINVASGFPDADYDLSEQNLLSCTGVSCDSGGMSPAAAFTWGINRGVPDDLCQVYKAIDSDCDDCCEDIDERSIMISEWDFVANGSPMGVPTVEQIKAAISTYGPIGTSMTVYSDLMTYQDGVYVVDDGATEEGGHSVVIVGWNDGNDSWYVKNSWGTSWGDHGYFEIKRGESGLGRETTSWATVDPASVPGSFVLSENEISASFQRDSGETADWTITLQRTAGDGEIPFRVSIPDDAPWLTVEPAEGTLPAGEDLDLVFTFDEAGWVDGTAIDQEVGLAVLGGPGLARGITATLSITNYYQPGDDDAGVDAGDGDGSGSDGCGCVAAGSGGPSEIFRLLQAVLLAFGV
jgi:hypothetical protein